MKNIGFYSVLAIVTFIYGVIGGNEIQLIAALILQCTQSIIDEVNNEKHQ